MRLCQATLGKISPMAQRGPSCTSEMTQRTPVTPRSQSDFRNTSQRAWGSVLIVLQVLV